MKISVCMATYNGGKYLREQMDSILGQDLSAYPEAELEIIVSDDLSTDDTLQILESYHDERIKVYKHTNKKSHKYYKSMFACTENFANAMEKCTGDYIFLSDQDDIWHPMKISRSLDSMIQGGHDMCMVGFHIITPSRKKLGTVMYEREPRWRLRRKIKLYGFSCGFTRKEMLSYLPFPNIPHHDNFMMLVSSFKNNYGIVNEPLALHKWDGYHNVSAFEDNSPFIVKNWYRFKQISVAYWRYLKSL